VITHKILDSRTYKKLIQILIQSLIQNSDSNETITLDFVRCFSVNITLSSLDLDEHISPCCSIFSKKISSSLFTFFLVEKTLFSEGANFVFILTTLVG